MPFLSNAMTWLNTTLKASDGETVTYQRGSDSVSITAPVGTTDGERMDSGGGIYSYTSLDFFISAADLVLAGQTVEPIRGDRIIWGSNVYTVTAQNNGEKPYTDSVPGGSVYRVHTKRTT